MLRRRAGMMNWNISYYQDPNLAVDSILGKFNDIIEKSTKNKNRIDEKRNPRKPWISKGLVKSCQTKNRLYKLWQQEPNNLERKNCINLQ